MYKFNDSLQNRFWIGFMDSSDILWNTKSELVKDYTHTKLTIVDLSGSFIVLNYTFPLSGILLKPDWGAMLGSLLLEQC